jgi:S-adenosylmethionine hydrolase
VARTYSAAGRGDLLALVGSTGFLELAVNQGNGAVVLNAEPGDWIEVRW